MQLFSRNKALIALSLGALAALGACGDDVTVTQPAATPVTVSISPPSASMNVGESLNFAVQITGGSTTTPPTLTGCVSSTPAVATATATGGACRVTAVAAGNATVTATASTGQSAAAAVSVAAPAASISGLSITPAASSVPVGQTVTLTPTVQRAGTAVTVAYAYATSAAAVATVNATTGVVTAVAPGIATITVTATGTGTGFASATLTSSAVVTVTALPGGLNSIAVQPSAVSIQQGRTAQLSPSAQQPQGAPAVTYAYASNTAAVATVNATSGLITAVAPGTAVITVTGTTTATPAFAASTQTALVTVTVTALPSGITSVTAQPATVSLAPSRKAQITASAAQPQGAAAATFMYSTNAPSVATVSDAGEITAVAAGSAVVTVTAMSAANANFAASSVTALVAVTVSDLQDGITALVVQPNSLDPIALGATAQLTAAVQQPTGAATATIGYVSSNPSIASVSATGLVTALSSGVANVTVTATSAAQGVFGLTTRTQIVRVNVSRSANVSIQTVTQGPVVTAYSSTSGSEGLVTSNNSQVNQPIDIANVRDQIQVAVNLEPFGQRTDSVVIFINDVAPGSVKRAAARQLFSNGVASNGVITLFVNTADFTANFTTGAADVFYRNGQKVISASVFTTLADGTTQEIQNAENNRQTVNFNNLDGYAARYVSPSRNVVGTGNLTWWGGPGAEGQGSYAIVPVFYSAGRSVTRIDIGLRQGLPSAASAQICQQSGQSIISLANTTLRAGSDFSTERYTALPFNGTYNSEIGRMIAGTGSSTSFATATNGNIECRGHVHANAATAQNFVAVEAGTDNFNNPAPVVTRFDGYRTSAQVAAIVPNRLDYAGPETIEPDIRRTGPGRNLDAGYPSLSVSNATWAEPAVTGWVNSAFNFQTQTAASTETNGVGLPTTSSRTWRFWGCNAGAGGTAPSTDTVSVAVPSLTGADIPECSSNNQGGWIPAAQQTGTAPSVTYSLWTRGPYRIGYIETDLLSNASVSPRSAPFGVDRTRPLIRISTASAADTLFGTGSQSIRAEVIDERSGFIETFDDGAQLRLPTSPTATVYSLVSGNFGSFQHFASRGASSANPATLARTNASNINCINPNSTAAMIASTNDPFNTVITTTSFSAFGANPITAPTCSFINQPATALAGFLADGYRPASAVTFSANGTYTYRARIFDRAGNVSEVPVGRTYSVNNATPTYSDLNVPGSIAATANPTFGTVISDAVEVRAYNVSVLYGSFGSRFVYPQTLLNARYDDVIGSQYTGTVTVPTAAPFVTALENNGTTTIPSFVSGGSPLTASNVANVNSVAFNTANTAANSATVGFGAVALPSLSTISGAQGSVLNPNFTTWRVMPLVSDLQPGFNAPAGIKAQLRGNTNVPNPPFVRTDFYRLNSTTSQYEYLGSASAAAQTDIGSDRFWTWTLTADLYAKTPTDLSTTQPQVALNDNIIAIGVRANGAGLMAPATTIGGASINFFGTTQVAASSGACLVGNSICFVQPPAGFPQIGTAAANITVSTVTASLPTTFTGATVTSTGILPVDVNGGTYAVTANSVVINGVTYTPSIVGTFQNVVVAGGTLTALPFRILYQPVLLGLTVSTNLPSLATPLNVTLTGTAGAATGITVGPVLINTNGQLVPVPASGTYSMTLASPTSITIGTQLYNAPVVGPAVVVGGPVPNIAVTYTLPTFPSVASFLTTTPAGFQATATGITWTAGNLSFPLTVAAGGTIVSANPALVPVTGAGSMSAAGGATTNVTGSFGTNTLTFALGFGTPLPTASATLAGANFNTPLLNTSVVDPQATTFGPVVTGSSAFFGGSSLTATYFPASLSITLTGQASPSNSTSPANWVMPTTTLTGPNSYSTQFTGGVATWLGAGNSATTFDGFENLQIGGTTRTVIVPVASPGVGSYQLSVPNTQVIGGTLFTISNCAAGAPTGSPSGTTGGAGAAVLSAQVTGGNCLLSINATYGSSASPILINYTAP